MLDCLIQVIESQVAVADNHRQEVETIHATLEQLADDMDTLASTNFQQETLVRTCVFVHIMRENSY
jgi:hypothetical protein